MVSCVFCSDSFASLTTLKLHMKLKHKDLCYYEVQCNVSDCSDKFSNTYSLLRHLKINHKIPEKINSSENLVSSVNDCSQITNTTMNDDEIDEKLIDISDENPQNPTISESVEEPANITVKDFANAILRYALLFITKLYAFNNLSRKFVNEIIMSMCNMYLTDCINLLQKKFANVVDLYTATEIIRKGFDKFKTEHLTFKFLQNIDCYFPPKMIIIRSFLKYKKVKRTKRLLVTKNSLSIIPIKSVIKKFLELPNVFSTIVENIEKIKSNSLIDSVIKGDFWKSVTANLNDKIIFPLILYFDDVEINNPLGSHKTIKKIGACYMSIPVIPAKYASKLENIFLFQLHSYENHKMLGNHKIFNKIIDELVELETKGITVKINGEEKQVFFVLPFIVGDNLGLNTILGFNKSFNSLYCCRICTIPKNELKVATKENEKYLRTKSEYSQHCSEKTFGILESWAFNKIPSFHVTDNFLVDPMHDLLEGVCRYDIAKILDSFINKDKLFTLDILNERIATFNYCAVLRERLG